MNDTTAPVTLINLFEVPEGADEGFIAAWEKARDSLRSLGAYLDTAPFLAHPALYRIIRS